MKKLSYLFLAFSLVLALAACSSSNEDASNPSNGGNSADPGGGKPAVAMVCSGSLGDTGIFDMGEQALVQAKADFGVSYDILEGKDDPSLYYELLQTAASSHDLVFVNPGYQFDSYLEEIADTYSDVLFVYADGTCGIERDNIISVSYKEHEGSYLAGVMAAMMTVRTEVDGINDQKVLGFVGAVDSPTINNFLTGFTQGVQSVDPDIQILSMYVGNFNDPALGKEMALSLYDQGCDIIYAAASNSGDGVSAAAKENGFYCIGVDTDKSPQAPENIMGSMLKNVATSFYDVIADRVDGKSLDVIQRKGLSDKWVEMYFNDYMNSFIPEDVMDAVKQAEADIVSGEIAVTEFQ